MNFPPQLPSPPPPRLSMDEYADFVMEIIRHADPLMVARQKALEEQITTPFRIPLSPPGDHTDFPRG